MANVTTSAETNLITATQMKRAREIDFNERFTHDGLQKLFEVMGVMRQIPMEEGTTLYVYKTVGTLQNGVVPEGEIIPLSQYERTKTAVGEITLKKWRKASSAEAIKKSGYNEAVSETDEKLLKDVQKGIRNDMFTFMQNVAGSTSATGEDLQGAWGQLQGLFEDDTIEAVYFVNPLDIADYLAKGQISTQTAFGMKYVEDFLGLGTVIISNRITKGTVIATAKENFIAYFLTMNGDIADAFELTADETGYVGIKSGYQNEERAQIESLVMSGVTILVEYAAGVVTGTINP